MHADGFLNTRQRHPVSLTAAIAINVVAVGALMLAKNEYVPHIPTILVGRNIPIPTDPPPVPDTPQPRAKASRATQIAPIVRTPAAIDETRPFTPVDDVAIDPGTLSTGITDLGKEIEKPAPVLVGAQVDRRYAGNLQPSYPPGKQRLNEEGIVTVRVLVGTDGRVHEIEPVGTVDPEFWRATQKQALARWRFTPATRDGVPYESWRQMTVRFQLGS